MTKLIITDTTEAAPSENNDDEDDEARWTGYWSLDIVKDYGPLGEQLVASMNFSPDMVPDVEDPDQLAQTFEEMATAFRGIADAAHDEDK